MNNSSNPTSVNILNSKANFKYEERIVTFIDILGFANIIKSTVTSDENLEKLANALTSIHDYFNKLKSGYRDPLILQISQFSDSIVISISMKESFDMLNIFKYLKTIQIHLISKGILLRGGIVKGKLIHTDELLLGPGMINAYYLESKCALHPRIVIDPRVLWQFSRISGIKMTERLRDFDYETSVAEEADGTSYIDYFNNLEDYLPKKGDIHKYFTSLCSIIRKHIDNDDISVRVKYLWMREKVKKCEYFDKYKTEFRGIVSKRNRKPIAKKY
jgi:hypothetical protein